MSTLFDSATCEAFVQRIQGLESSASAEWGKMDPTQMLAHCRQPLRVASGDLKLGRSFIGRLFGRMAKGSLVGPKPFKPNLPTDKRFLVNDASEFATEQRELVTAVKAFASGGLEGISKDPHPFFGALSGHEWEILVRKHLDHHLRQFGA